MSKQAKTHAVVGSGTAPTKVIQEGLRDVVANKDAVNLVWMGAPNATMEDVYDFVLDNEINFVMYYAEGVNPARVFRESEHGIVQKVRNPHTSALTAVENGGKVLFLWNEDDPDDQVEFVFDTIETGTLVLDLTNGMSPISVEMDIPEPVDPELAKDEDEPDEDTDFTKDELEVMTPFAVKRYGERKGCSARTKGGIIAELFPDGVLGSPSEEADEEVEPSPTGVSAPAAPSSSSVAEEFPEPPAGEDLAVVLANISAGLDILSSALTAIAVKVYSS